MTPLSWLGVVLVALGVLAFIAARRLSRERQDDLVLLKYPNAAQAFVVAFVGLCLAGAVVVAVGWDSGRGDAAGQAERQAARRRSELPPGAVVLEEQTPTWWLVSVGGRTYLAQWVYSGQPHWQLTPAG